MSIKDKLYSKNGMLCFLGLTLAGAIMLSTPPPKDRIVILENHDTDSLVFNNSDKYRNITHKNEVDGVKDIEQLVSSSQLEESWLYHPTEQVWEETGIFSGKDEEHNFVESLNFMERLSKEGKSVYAYHFHPAKRDEKTVKEMLYTIWKVDNVNSVSSDYPLEQKANYLFWVDDALPSALDLSTMIRNFVKFYSREPKGEAKWKICSKYGVTDYYLTEKGKSFYASKTSQEIEERLQVKRPEFNLLIRAGPFPPKYNPITVIKNICSAFNDELIKCNFVTYAEFYSQPISTKSENL